MMRQVLAANLALTVILFAQYMAATSTGRTRGENLTMIGTFLFTTTILASMYKAQILSVPFDAYSWAIFTAVTIFNGGLALSLWERRPWKRG